MDEKDIPGNFPGEEEWEAFAHHDETNDYFKCVHRR
jgi:hypothetical protein